MKTKESKKQVNPIDLWLERDLTRSAKKGELAKAHGRASEISQFTEILRCGKAPVLTGETGVGKSAILHEVIRRACDGEYPDLFRGKRILQLSIQKRAASLKKGSQIGEEMDRLGEVLLKKTSIIPYFRDFHLAYDNGLEAHFQSLFYRLSRPIICEGSEREIASLFEWSPELESNYVALRIEEPSLESAKIMLHGWRQDRKQQDDIGDDAIDAALTLSHRFLVRTKLPRKAVDLIEQARTLTPDDIRLTGRHVIDRFCSSYRVPRELVDPSTPLKLSDLEDSLSEDIIGQSEAVQAVSETLGVIKAGLADAKRPFGVFLFVGPSGVGKTHIVQLLASRLFGDRERIIRINMADFQEKGGDKVLFGDETADYRQKQRGVLTRRLAGQPFAVLLLDEFEKSTKEVHDRFFQLFDEGSFINGMGESISCRSLIIIATSNAGGALYSGQSLGFKENVSRKELAAAVDSQLRRVFRPELLNRFDGIIQFFPLTVNDSRELAIRELLKLEDRPGLKNRSISLQFDPSVIEWIGDAGIDSVQGARYLRRRVEQTIVPRIAEALERSLNTHGVTLYLEFVHGRIACRTVDDAKRSTDDYASRELEI